MTTNTILFNDIYTLIKAFAVAQGVPLAYQFNSFTPPAIGAWIELSTMINDRDHDLNNSPIFRRGFIQLNVGGKKDSGDSEQRALIDAIEAAFPMGTVLSGSIKTTTNPKSEAPFIRNSTDYITQVTIEYNE